MNAKWPVLWILGGSVLLSSCALHSLPGPRPLSETDLTGYYEKEAGVRPVAVGQVDFHDGGPAIHQAMLNLVESAQDYILIDTFLLTDGPGKLSRSVLDALIQKNRQGVEVYVIGDASSRFVPEEPAFEYLEAAGVPVAEFHPIGPARLVWLPFVMIRDHRKFWVVDGRLLFLGGANVNDPSLSAPDDGGNMDLMVEFESTVAAGQLVESFVETWNRSKSKLSLEVEQFAKNSKVSDEPSDTDFWVFNQDRIVSADAPTHVMIDGLMASAEESVWMIQPYNFTNPHIVADCRELVESGVEVNLVLSTAVRAPRFHYASYYGIKSLLETGVHVWIYECEVSPLHYKCALVDDRLAYVGSANLNLRSFRLSRELNVVFDDPEAVATVKELIDGIREDCRRVTMDEAKRYRGPHYLGWWLAMQAAG